jgi:hypothetical protein
MSKTRGCDASLSYELYGERWGEVLRGNFEREANPKAKLKSRICREPLV